ncbi:Hypothetical_protein [Hexamita inflata]|uniref:Hypothetical_protein n=1 Tax=Hexamita inflata TaxID=28002 RepID=A0AA86UM30_9EUKA|nr:Hypothetical protein HINF_LOCUS44357 [Hexamita inflata]
MSSPIIFLYKYIDINQPSRVLIQITKYSSSSQSVKCETALSIHHFLQLQLQLKPAIQRQDIRQYLYCTQTQNKQLKMKKTFIETNENGTEAVVDRILFFQLKEKVVCVFVLVRFEWNWIDFVSNCSFYDYILAHSIVKYFQHSIPRTLLRYLA